MECKRYKGGGESVKIVCRCNDVTEEDIVRIIEEGYTDVEEIKRILMVGTGPCQGNTCMIHLARLVFRYTKEQRITNVRPPENPVELGVFADEE